MLEVLQTVDKENNGDEMDICTTPPPNVNEVLTEVNNHNGKKRTAELFKVL